MCVLRRVVSPILVVFALVLGTVACSPGVDWRDPGETPDPPKVNLVGPLDGATGVPTSAELEFTLEGTNAAEVTLTDAAGTPIAGEMRDDGSSWLPGEQLAYSTQYTATITATKSDGSSAQATATFTTMDPPAQTARIQSYNGDQVTYGVGMPVIIRFDTLVPDSARAAIQRRMFVESNPPQEGVWHWMSSRYHDLGSEVHFRPKEYWQPGTTIHVRIATGGMPWGYEGLYGGNDLTLDFSIGDALIMDVDNATKQMVVTRNGQVVNTIPVSLGKPSTPSSFGQTLIMSKHAEFTFDTRRELGNREGYVTDVEFAEQLTTGGEFIHAAPWSVNQQGNTNVSHGCVNMSTDNARWIYENVNVGDPVITRGTEVPLEWGNGFTDWNISWEEYLLGSAIPYAPPTSASPTPSTSPTA
ncbi:MAG TPA: Ig-like domain-containing protein [Jiangellales bacterium]|nr:Ig-like domain-containing protein [Jiangellales bacterium]